MISMILAMNLNGTIGDKGRLPWDAPDDMKWFKDIIKGRYIVGSWKTLDGIPEPTLSDSFVCGISREMGNRFEDIIEFLENTGKNPLIIGGGEIYKLFLPHAEKLYLSIIPQVFYGDTTFELNWNEWKVVYSEGSDDSMRMILERIKGETI